MNSLLSFEEACRIIERGAPVLIAADEYVLSRLPRGDWIGGTIPIS